jgi:type IV secretory pathway VirB10-like protein
VAADDPNVNNEHEPVPPVSQPERPLPDPAKLSQGGLTDGQKRRIFFVVIGVVGVIVLANILGSHSSVPAKQPTVTQRAQQQNPTREQIQAWEDSVQQSQKQLEEEMKQRGQTADRTGNPALTAADLQRQDALREAEDARRQYEASQRAADPEEAERRQRRAQREEQAYKSLFADNLVRQQNTQPVSFSHAPASVAGQQGEVGDDPQPVLSDAPQSGLQTPRPGSSAAQVQSDGTAPSQAARGAETSTQKKRPPLDYDPAGRYVYYLPEGTIIESVLTNRLDGDQPGPVNAMITTDVYLPGTRLLLIPQGARAMGEASSVSNFGQQRLAVAFHRIMIPGLHGYGISLDQKVPGLSQEGAAGLHDKVNSHYVSIFGASLAIGAIGGLAQIGNGFTGFGYDPSVQFRNGISQSMAQSADRVLDRFLNRMPTITIREGTRVKIVLTGDLAVPAYGLSKGDF